MKARLFTLFTLVVGLALALTWAVTAQGPESPTSNRAISTPVPTSQQPCDGPRPATCDSTQDIARQQVSGQRFSPQSEPTEGRMATLGAAPQSAENVELVSQFGGETYAVAVQGSYAYIGIGPRLVVLDISNPATPVEVGSCMMWTCAGDIYVAGAYAYLTTGSSGLRIVDISNPATPREVGVYDPPWGSVTRVHVVGHYAYVVDYNAGLHIVDVSNPAAPLGVGTYDMPEVVNDIYVAGNYVYLAWGIWYSPRVTPGGLRIIDVSDPATPRFVGGYYDYRIAKRIYVAGTYAYLTSYACRVNDLLVIDVSNPAAPVQAGVYGTPWCSDELYVSGQYAYVTAQCGAGLRVIDVSNPAAPVEVGACAVVEGTAWAWNVYVAGHYAYVVVQSVGLRVVNIANPVAPVLVGAYNTPGYVTSVYVASSYAYVSGRNGLRVIDVANPAIPVQVGATYTGTYQDVGGIYVAGAYAYLAAGYDGLRIVDVSNPAMPREVGAYGSPRDFTSVHIVGCYAYVVDYDAGGLRVIDISNPAAPYQLGFYAPLGYVFDIYVVGHYAYLATEANWDQDCSCYVGGGLRVIDISDPTAPVEVGALNTLGKSLHVYVAGHYAYVATEHGLRIVDVSDPSTPVQVWAYSTPGWTTGVELAGNYAYVSWETWGTAYLRRGGLRVIDMADPTAPIEVGFYDMPLAPQDIYVSGSFIYVTDGADGLMILRYAPSASAAIPTTGGSLTSPADRTTYTFAAGTFTDTVIINHTIRSPGNVPSTGNLPSIGHCFVTTAVYSGTNQLAQVTRPYTITVQYTDAETRWAAEGTLGLYHWDGFQWEWVKEPTSVVDTDNNTITAMPGQFGMWAVLGERWQLFLMGISTNSTR